MTTIQFELTDDQAEALAQMTKRISLIELRALSATVAERDHMNRALNALRKSLNVAGFDPR